MMPYTHRCHGRGTLAAATIAMCFQSLASSGTTLADEPFQAQLRLLTQNVWGLAEANCGQRASAFGHIVAHAEPPFDIVGLNEHYDNFDGDIWTCDGAHLSNAVWSTGRYGNANQYYRYYPENLTRPNGGIGIFTMGSICEFYETQFSHNDGYTAVQGLIFARVRIPGSTVTLDVYVTHLHARDADDCPRCCRVEELERLRTVIRQHSARSGNPVLVLGDFNIGGPPSCCGNHGHEDIMSILGNPRDLWLEAHSCEASPHTVCGDPSSPCEDESPLCFTPEACTEAPAPEVSRCVDRLPLGNGDVQCTVATPVPLPSAPAGCDQWKGWAGATWDQCLNEHADSEYRIDYIFVITDPTLTSSAFDVVLTDAKITDWTALIELFVEEPFETHVSDHLGVEATIQVFGRSSVWVDHAFPFPLGGGTSCVPFVTVQAGVVGVPVGDRVLIREGRYPERLRIDKPMTLQAVGGLVIIGS